MKHCVLMLIHKDVELVNALLPLYPNSWDIYIHIDKKSNITFKNIVRLSNVVWIGKQIDVGWQTYEMVDAELLLLRTAYKQQYDYYHLVSGQCLPLRTENEIDNIISQYKGKSFINKVFETRDGRKFEKFYFGSQWWSLSRETVDWIFNNYHRVEELDREYTKHLISKDEFIFQTLLYNDVPEMLVNDNLRYIKFFASVHPQIVGIDKYDILMTSRFILTRKVDFENSKELINTVKQRLL